MSRPAARLADRALREDYLAREREAAERRMLSFMPPVGPDENGGRPEQGARPISIVGIRYERGRLIAPISLQGR